MGDEVPVRRVPRLGAFFRYAGFPTLCGSGGRGRRVVLVGDAKQRQRGKKAPSRGTRRTLYRENQGRRPSAEPEIARTGRHFRRSAVFDGAVKKADIV